MKQSIKISVIVPVYNVEGYLEQCIESILSQSYKNIQLIIVDDGSTDGSGSICDRYANQATIIHKANGGVSTARNAGIEKATGEYILFVDGDDYIEKNMVDVLLKNLDDADSITFGYQRPKPKGINMQEIISHTTTLETEISWKDYNLENNRERGSFIVNMLLQHKVNWEVALQMFRSDIIKQHFIRFEQNIPNGEDLLFTLSFFLHAKKIRTLNWHPYYYVDRDNSVTHFYDFDKNWNIVLEICTRLYSKILPYGFIDDKGHDWLDEILFFLIYKEINESKKRLKKFRNSNIIMCIRTTLKRKFYNGKIHKSIIKSLWEPERIKENFSGIGLQKMRITMLFLFTYSGVLLYPVIRLLDELTYFFKIKTQPSHNSEVNLKKSESWASYGSERSKR